MTCIQEEEEECCSPAWWPLHRGPSAHTPCRWCVLPSSSCVVSLAPVSATHRAVYMFYTHFYNWRWCTFDTIPINYNTSHQQSFTIICSKLTATVHLFICLCMWRCCTVLMSKMGLFYFSYTLNSWTLSLLDSRRTKRYQRYTSIVSCW